MLRSLHAAERAMKIQQARIDVMANNMANAGTTGFKQILTQVLEVQGKDPGRRPAIYPDKPGSYPGQTITEMRAAVDQRPGTFRSTGRQLDLAIRGEGFFVVSDGNKEFYTRAGSFHLNGEHKLVTANGHEVQGTGGPITINGSGFEIGTDGTVMVDGSEAGKVKLVTFEDLGERSSVGANLFSVPEGVNANDVPADQVLMEPGMLEQSNVSTIDTMVDMIAAQRAFEVQSKVVNTADRTLDKSVNSLGNTV